MEQIYTQIRQYIDENRQPMLNLWRDLVNTESGTTQIDGVNAVCSILRREMENAGIHTRVRAIQNSGDMLIGEWNPGSAKAPLLLIGHMDTVFKEGAAKENPFRVDENGMAHGPGVLDMKAGLVMALYTVKALDSVDWKERPIKFIFASDEENLHMRSDAKEIFAEEAAGALQLRDRLHGQPFRGRPQGRRPGQHQDSRQSIPLGHCAGEGPLGGARGSAQDR